MTRTLTHYRVIYGDTDQMGVVYYGNYLRWFEMGRTEFLREIGIPYSVIEEKGLYFPVTEVSCRYLRPARFDDLVLIETTLTSLGRVTLSFSYRIYRQTDGPHLTSGWTRHACVDRNGQVTKLPGALDEPLKAALAAQGKTAIDKRGS